MVYFTSDLHLGHRAIISLQNRPFADVSEMNEEIIRKYNERVGNNDTVYILGDISHRITQEETRNFVRQLKGKKILITGNHDKHFDHSLFDEVSDFKCVSLSGWRFALMHYPMAAWPYSVHGGIQLHGHCHFTAEYNRKNAERGLRRYDVGVDANSFAPYRLMRSSAFLI